MGLRYGRRIKVGPGLYVNLSKSGMSWSLKTGPMTNTFTKKGRRTTLNLPGGLYYVFPMDKGKKESSNSKSGQEKSTSSASKSAQAPSPNQGPPAHAIPNPGFMAPAVEKRFVQGLRALIDGDTATAIDRFQQAVEADADNRHDSDDLMAGIALLQAGRIQEAIPYFEEVVESDTPLPDEMMERYVGELVIPTPITPHVVVDIPMSTAGAMVLLAEAYQVTGDMFGATGALEELIEYDPTNPVLRLSLAELYYAQGLDNAIIELTDGLTLTDDVSYAALTFRALSLLAQQHVDAALDVANTLLRDRRKFAPDLVQDALFTRGMIYDAKAQKAKAHADFEKLYALNSAYPGLDEWLHSPAT